MEEILSVVNQLISEKGTKFSIEDITLRLNISRRTVYEVFPNKNAMILAAIKKDLIGLESQFDEILSKNELDSIEKMIEIQALAIQYLTTGKLQYIRLVKKTIPEAYDIYNTFMKDFWETIKTLYDEGIEQGKLRNIDFKIYQIIINGFVDQLICSDQSENYENITIKWAIENLSDVIFNGSINPSFIDERKY